MISMLLWRCPLCAANDALVHVARRFRPERVACTHCDARWQVRRVPGDNFYLKLIRGDRSAVGIERSITAWYDEMKKTLRLLPISDPAVALESDETLYLASKVVELQVEETDPLFFPEKGDHALRLAKSEVNGVSVGQGRLFLTNRRLIWMGGDVAASFPLGRVNSAYALMDFGVAFLIETRLYTVYFPGESVLKWVTYLALVGQQVLAETGHRIACSHF